MNANVRLPLVLNIVVPSFLSFCSLALGSVPSQRESERGGKKVTTPEIARRNLYPLTGSVVSKTRLQATNLTIVNTQRPET